ncbi:ROK family protein [bacterium]|nr:ROK family protein [bacterium]
MPKKNYTIGIDVGGTKILAAILDQDQNIVGRAKKKTRVEEGVEAVLVRIVDTVNEALAASKVALDQVRTVGICVPGPAEPDTGVIIEAPNLGWRNLNIIEFLVKTIGRPAYLSNDVTAGTWAEFSMGAGRGARNLLGVFIGTGIGGGIIIDGQLYEGSGRQAGEIGHICLNPHGPVCGCGRHGCLEAYASRTAMTRDIKAALDRGIKSSITKEIDEDDRQIRSRQLRQAFLDGDKVVTDVVKQAAYFLGIGLGSLANVLNPDCIVLGGGVVEAFGDAYVKQVNSSFKRFAFQSVYDKIKLVQAGLGDDAGVVGAALIARRKHAAAGKDQA